MLPAVMTKVSISSVREASIACKNNSYYQHERRRFFNSPCPATSSRTSQPPAYAGPLSSLYSPSRVRDRSLTTPENWGDLPCTVHNIDSETPECAGGTY